LNFSSEIWRTRKKTISTFMDLGFDREFELWPKSFVQLCARSCQTCLWAN
jgi:hypothetical protein